MISRQESVPAFPKCGLFSLPADPRGQSCGCWRIIHFKGTLSFGVTRSPGDHLEIWSGGDHGGAAVLGSDSMISKGFSNLNHSMIQIPDFCHVVFF